MDLNNLPARIFQGMQVAFATVTVTAGVPSLTQQSGSSLSDQPMVTVADTGTGLFTVSAQNFRGANSYIAAFVTVVDSTASDYTASVKSQAYTAGTDTANFAISTLTAGTVADGASFNIMMLAF